MKSSMTFIQSNGCIEIDLIFTKFGGSTYDVTSALKYYFGYYYKAPVVKLSKICRHEPWRHIFSFWHFCLLPVPHNSVNPVQMKSSMTFIQSNGCIEIDLIFTKFGGSTYDVTSALKYYCRYYYKAPVVKLSKICRHERGTS